MAPNLLSHALQLLSILIKESHHHSMHTENVLEMVSLNNQRLKAFYKSTQCLFIWDLGPKQFNVLQKWCVSTMWYCVSVTLSCSGVSQNAVLIAQPKCYKLLQHDIPTLWARRINVRNDNELFIVKVPSASWNSSPLFSFTHEHAPKVSQQVFRKLCRNFLILLYTPILTESSVFLFTRR